MSDYAYQTGTLYGLNYAQPPDTWSLMWSASDENTVDSSIPDGFYEVDRDTWLKAQEAQERAKEHSEEQAAYDYRVILSQQRKDLVNAGLSYEVAKILVPDPLGDYSIDVWHNA